MLDFLLAFAWIFLTLLFASFGAFVAKRHGVEFVFALVAVFVVISNVLASKVVQFLWWSVPAGFVVYSSVFLLTDFLSEFFGREEAKRAVWCGLYANLFYVFSVLVVLHWEPAAFWENSAAFSSVLGLSVRVTLASLLAYLVSQFNDVFLFHRLKSLTRGRHLWLRNNLSTLVSQFLDTVIFISIAFYGLFPLVPMILGQYVVKLLVALLDTPFLYAVRYFSKTRIRLR